MKEGSRLLIEQLDGVIGELALKEGSRSWKGKNNGVWKRII
jgi:hypothetical protein